MAELASTGADGVGPVSRAPRSFWVVAVLSLLWNAFGVFDYLMTQLGDEAYLAQFTPSSAPISRAFRQ